MNERVLLGPPPETLTILLEDAEEHDFPSPVRMLAELTPEEAVTVPTGLPYSVADIVAHMNANMKFNLVRRLIGAWGKHDAQAPPP